MGHVPGRDSGVTRMQDKAGDTPADRCYERDAITRSPTIPTSHRFALKEGIMRNSAYAAGREELVLAVSLELATASWKIACHDGRRDKPAVHTLTDPQAGARLQAALDL